MRLTLFLNIFFRQVTYMPAGSAPYSRPVPFLHRHYEFLHEVLLPLGRVLAHVEGENLLAVHFGRVFAAAEISPIILSKTRP